MTLRGITMGSTPVCQGTLQPCPVVVMRQVIEKMYMREATICYGLTENSPVITQTLIGDGIQRQTASSARR